jgi:hypothetical protein
LSVAKTFTGRDAGSMSIHPTPEDPAATAILDQSEFEVHALARPGH